jgi:hypothetical protein
MMTGGALVFDPSNPKRGKPKRRKSSLNVTLKKEENYSKQEPVRRSDFFCCGGALNESSLEVVADLKKAKSGENL